MIFPRFAFKMIFTAVVFGLCLSQPAQAQATRDQNARRDLPKIVRKSGGVLAGEAVKKVEPSYPPLAKAARVSGQVVVEITIDEEGNVISARPLSGHPLLKDATVNAARGWKFKPTLLSGEPVKVIGTLTFNFNLDHSKEIEAIKQEIAANPNSADLYYRLGSLYSLDGHHAKAIEAYKQALNLGLSDSDIYSDLAESHEALGQFDEAIEATKQGLSVVREPAGAEKLHIALGRVYLKQGRNEEAAEAFRQAAVINPDSEEAHYNLGLAYLRLGDKQSAMNEYTILKNMNSRTAEQLLGSINRAR